MIPSLMRPQDEISRRASLLKKTMTSRSSRCKYHAFRTAQKEVL